MRALSRTAAALACAACIAGCATESTVPSAIVTSPRAKVTAAERAQHAVTIGTSTKADIAAALGQTLVIGFDNGYEVWVYRLAEDRRGEFVVLFDPSGVVKKTRVRLSR